MYKNQQKPPQQPSQSANLYNLVSGAANTTSKAQPNISNNHPNLNKLLLNSTNSQKQLNQAPKLEKQNIEQSLTIKQQKKRQHKNQELYEDDEDEDDDDSESDSDDDESTRKIKMEDTDSDSMEMDNGDTTGDKASCNGGHSNSSSFINSESLFDLMMSSKNRDAYFWQYNVQSKGPKTRKVLTLRNKDPHLHRDFFDPVFQLQSLNARNGTTLNKLRKGDGNDVTPNADKLYNLGNQIRDFIQKSFQMNSACFSPPPTINGGLSSSSLNQLCTTPNTVNFLSSSVDAVGVSKNGEKSNLKREKNKIASRACRLKKKAQHEANKIKLSGLNDEHSKSKF